MNNTGPVLAGGNQTLPDTLFTGDISHGIAVYQPEFRW